MFKPKFDLLSLEKRKEIFDYAIDNTPKQAAEKYYNEAGMSFIGLYTRLLKYVKSVEQEENVISNPLPRISKNQKEPDRKLSKSDKELLDKFEKGEVSLEEISRKVSRMAFERMLLHPDSVRYHDFIKTELLKLKQQEQKLSEKWGNELLARMFAGKLPPDHCPKCGHSFIEEGEIVHEPISLTAGV